MKKKKPTLKDIRGKLNAFQKELLEEIWRHFLSKREWPLLRELYRTHGKLKVDKALNSLAKGIGRNDSSGNRWRKYSLTLLGTLLTKDGLTMQALMAGLFQFQRHLFQTSPKSTEAKSEDIQRFLKLSAEQTALLGLLVQLGNFGGGWSSDPNASWSVSAMEEAETFPKTGGLSDEFDKWICEYYEPNAPVFLSRPDNQYFGEPLSTGLATASTPPHLTEIAVSLNKLRKKYPDADKLGFLVMRFTEGKPFQRIANVIKRTAEKLGLVVIRADENHLHADLWGNVRTLLHGCSFGIAVYERIDTNEPNANVGLEVGYLMAMSKPVLLLKDKSVAALPADLAGKLYTPFDPHDPEKTIPEQMTKWLEDHGIIVP